MGLIGSEGWFEVLQLAGRCIGHYSVVLFEQICQVDDSMIAVVWGFL
jgi:hypothetical protein